MSNIENVKCHKCRYVLISNNSNIHSSAPCGNQTCSSYNTNSFIYFYEDRLPEWIKLKVEEDNWTKGKLHCANCGCKVGSFDFVSGRKCECGDSVLPPVHFVSSQVDIPILLKLTKKLSV